MILKQETIHAVINTSLSKAACHKHPILCVHTHPPTPPPTPQGIKPAALEKVKDPVLREIVLKCTGVDKSNRYCVSYSDRYTAIMLACVHHT